MSQGDGPSFKEGVGYTVVLGVIVVVLLCMNPKAGDGLAILLAIALPLFYFFALGWLPMEWENRKRAKRGLPPKKLSEFDTREPGDWGQD